MGGAHFGGTVPAGRRRRGLRSPVPVRQATWHTRFEVDVAVGLPIYLCRFGAVRVGQLLPVAEHAGTSRFSRSPPMTVFPPS